MDKIARLRQEIERRRQAIRALNEYVAPEQMSKTCAIFQYSDSVLSELLSFLDTLSEDPELVRHPPIAYTYPSDASRDEQLKMALLALLNSDLIKVAGNKFTKQDLIDWVEKQKELEEPDKSLEEAARKYGFEEYRRRCNGGEYGTSEDAFKAGAEWQKQQDLAEMAQSKSPLSIAYANRCFENGKKAMKEQMLKDAIYYVVQDDLDSHGASYNIPFIRIGTTALKPKGIGVGDKVKVIVLKEED